MKLDRARRLAWLVVLAAGALGAAAAMIASRAPLKVDPLALLPQEAPEVRVFREIDARFGSTGVAIVGRAAPDVLAPEFFRALQRITERLNQTPGIDHALSLANVEDFTTSERGGVETGLLVPDVPAAAGPEGDAGRSALWARIAARDLVVGQLVAPDRKAVLIYCFPGRGVEPAVFAERVRRVVVEDWPDARAFGGAPFLAQDIAASTRGALVRFGPWAALAMALVMLLVLGDVRAALVALVTTGLAAVLALGAFAGLGGQLDLISSAGMLVVVGCGGALATVAAAACGAERAAAPGDPTRGDLAGRDRAGYRTAAVVAAACAALGALLSAPIPSLFGAAMLGAVGLGIAWALARAFVPAAMQILGMPARRTGAARAPELRPRTAALASAATAAVALGALLVFPLAGARQADCLDPRSGQGETERLLSAHFGGARWLQVEWRGDLTSPHVLREIEHTADRIALLPGVVAVQHIGRVVAESNAAMAGERRIPDDPAQVKLLYRFLSGKAAVRQLLSPERDAALVHVRLADDAAPGLVGEIESLVGQAVHRGLVVGAGVSPAATAARLEAVTWRVRALARAAGVAVPPQAVPRIVEGLTRPAEADPEAVTAAIARDLGSGECPVDLASRPDLRATLAAELTRLGPRPDAAAVRAVLADAIEGEDLGGVTADAALIEDLAASLETPLEESWRHARHARQAAEVLRAAGVVVPMGEIGRRFRGALEDALAVLSAPDTLVPDGDEWGAAGPEDGSGTGPNRGARPRSGDTVTMTTEVSGPLILDRAVAASARSSQWAAAGLGLGAALLTLLLLAAWAGGVGAAATSSAAPLLALLVFYAGSAALGFAPDPGTALVATAMIGVALLDVSALAGAARAAGAAGAATGGDGPEAAAGAAARRAVLAQALAFTAAGAVLAFSGARGLERTAASMAGGLVLAAVAALLTAPLVAACAPRPDFEEVPGLDPEAGAMIDGEALAMGALDDGEAREGSRLEV